jgi:hypothetical protein
MSDPRFVDQVEKLCQLARNAFEEAVSYQMSIGNPEIRKEADLILDNTVRQIQRKSTERR